MLTKIDRNEIKDEKRDKKKEKRCGIFRKKIISNNYPESLI